MIMLIHLSWAVSVKVRLQYRPDASIGGYQNALHALRSIVREEKVSDRLAKCRDNLIQIVSTGCRVIQRRCKLSSSLLDDLIAADAMTCPRCLRWFVTAVSLLRVSLSR